MTVLTNSFEGGTSGTTITTGNSGGASGNAFDVVSVGSGNTLAFSNTVAAHGKLSLEVSLPATSSSYVGWSTSLGTQSQVWFRAYLFFTAFPASGGALIRFLSGGTEAMVIYVLTSGQLRAESASFTTVFTTVGTIPVGQWFRIEGYAIGSASVGQISLQVYDSANSTIPTESITSAATQNTLGSFSAYYFGAIASAGAIGPFWMDDIGLSSTGYLGPVATAAQNRPSAVPALIVAGVI